MTKIKIFISSDLYFGQTTGYLFGYITQTKESITFYLLRSSSDDSNLSGSGQLFGEICDVKLFKIANVKNATNFLHFVRGTENILLNQVFINGSPDVLIETVQIILYDHTKWAEVSADYLPADINNEDCIKCLSFFIHEEFRKSRSLGESNSRWDFKHLRIIMFALIPLLNMVNKLTVVKHMRDWYHCLQYGSNKKFVDPLFVMHLTQNLKLN